MRFWKTLLDKNVEQNCCCHFVPWAWLCFHDGPLHCFNCKSSFSKWMSDLHASETQGLPNLSGVSVALSIHSSWQRSGGSKLSSFKWRLFSSLLEWYLDAASLEASQCQGSMWSSSSLSFTNSQETIRNCFIIGPRWKVRTGVVWKPAARPEEDSVILVNLSSCCKNFLNASYHLLLMLSRLGWKPGGFPAPSCPTYNGVILDLFPVIPASSSVSSAYSWVFLTIFFSLHCSGLVPWIISPGAVRVPLMLNKCRVFQLCSCSWEEGSGLHDTFLLHTHINTKFNFVYRALNGTATQSTSPTTPSDCTLRRWA